MGRGVISIVLGMVLMGDYLALGQADRGVKTGALSGGAIGLLLGSIFFPIGGIALGALAGAGIGASANIGIE